MQQDFDVLSLVQVLNPLYAFPIVAVILYAFLVYAFGFKKPVQPPSFDDLLEAEKKPTKKRKVKDNSKGKQQNGKIPTYVVKGSENTGPSGKKKHEKSPGKSEEKAVPKKAPVAEKKKKQNVHQFPAPIIEENNDEGWVHHVSKKGRKNRKKDDAMQHMEVSEPPIQNDIFVEQHYNNFNDSNLCKEKMINGSGETIEDCVSVPVVEKQNIKVKLVVKPNAMKKQLAKDKIDSTTNSGKILAYTKVDEHGCKNGLSSTNIIESESSELESSVANDPMKTIQEQPKRPKKKKKKKLDDDDDDPSCFPAVIESLPNFPSSNTVSSGLPTINSHEVTDNVHKVNELNENVGLIADEPKDMKNCEEAENKGSNVAFDELEGLCSDVKVARKRKRVRRDH